MLKMKLYFLLSLILPVVVRAQTIPYTSCPGCWDPDSLGNHRVSVRSNVAGAVAYVHIPWRLRV